MADKLIIDLEKCRECTECSAGNSWLGKPFFAPVKRIREMAVFQFTCRRCESAPCIEVCPVEALAKGPDGVVTRSLVLCVACNSCVAACPFGTLMNDFFDYRMIYAGYFYPEHQEERTRLIASCPQQALSFGSEQPDPSKNLWPLGEHILIREYTWEKLKEEPEVEPK
ncbi:MAG: hypothetical protein GYA22_02070 [Bacteroidales bacterium]|nr:hypothetical protein [Bacteroidales bacterium]